MKKLQTLSLLVVLAATLFVSAASQAAVIRYQFTGVTFEDGATASGYFDWDTFAPQTVAEYEGGATDYEISVTGGGDFTVYTYTQAVDGPFNNGGSIGGIRILKVGDAGNAPANRQLSFIPDALAATLGVDLGVPLLISPGNSSELITVPSFQSRQLTAGSLNGTVIASDPPPAPVPVPVPVGPAWMLLGLIALLGFTATRKTRRQF
jgi:hypothetical protein